MQSKIPGGCVPAWIPSSVFWISSGASKAKRQLTEETGRHCCGSTPRGTLSIWGMKNSRAHQQRSWLRREGGMGNGVGRGAFFPPLFLWTTGGLPGHLAAVAQRVRPGWGWGLGAGGAKVEHQPTVQPGLIPRLCRCRSVRHGQLLKGGEAESQLSLSFSHLSVHWLIVRVAAATFIISSTYLIRKIMAAPASRSIARWLMHFWCKPLKIQTLDLTHWVWGFLVCLFWYFGNQPVAYSPHFLEYRCAGGSLVSIKLTFTSIVSLTVFKVKF